LKKIFLIILLCFMISLSMFAIDMSPQPGDTIETVFTVMDVFTSQAVSAPAIEYSQFNILNSISNEICLSANEEITGTTYGLFNSGLTAVAVSYIGYEMETIFYKPVENVAIYCMQYG